MASVGWVGACPNYDKGSRGYLIPTWQFQGECTSHHDPGSGPHPTRETLMRFFTTPHRFYCGIDLHARTMHGACRPGPEAALVSSCFSN